MPTYYSTETNGVLDTQGPARAAAQHYRSKMKRIRATRVTTGEAIADTIVLGELPVGAVFSHGIINASATLGAIATLSIGTVASPASHRAAAVFTTPDTPTLFGKVAASAAAPLAVVTRLIATVAAAALAVGVTLEIDIFYSDTV